MEEAASLHHGAVKTVSTVQHSGPECAFTEVELKLILY